MRQAHTPGTQLRAGDYRGSRQVGNPAQARQRMESCLGAGPLLPNGLGSSAPNHASQHESDEDRVVGVAEDRHEVGNEVHRERQIAEEQEQSKSNRAAQRRVTAESADEPASRPARFRAVFGAMWFLPVAALPGTAEGVATARRDRRIAATTTVRMVLTCCSLPVPAERVRNGWSESEPSCRSALPPSRRPAGTTTGISGALLGPD